MTGRYTAAEKGQIESLPGVDAEYQTPPAGDVMVSGEDQIDAEQRASRVISRFLRDFIAVENKD